MTSVLVLGESWFTYTVHQKGFDAFYTSDYVEGAGVFLDSLAAHGHEVEYLPSHRIDGTSFDRDFLDRFDVVVISDVGANTFLLPAETFTKSIPTPDKTEQLRAYVERGGSLLMVGGYLSFSGIDAKARWGRTALADALPVALLDRDDRVELPAGVAPTVATAHPVVDGLDPVWPALLGLNEFTQRPGATTLAECAEHPLLVVGEYGQGRSAAFASDLAPHWAPAEFLAWDGYARLWDQLIRWLAAEPDAR
ncbi:glutamine amidotransferase [Agromyces sp. NBRC 114283]|uniref:glutamine amidotransferase n=1 Tax=Agromyces sp. NBRC 114283 TaxID=2994521 RepID=UPI0024A14BD0|nr:glutamine amidotransferase [Agromyces sp. NBRC 114283]GLU89707.1 hypothetical protein Agsp01_19620 [Agromyces sp. NBRC 114283]